MTLLPSIGVGGRRVADARRRWGVIRRAHAQGETIKSTNEDVIQLHRKNITLAVMIYAPRHRDGRSLAPSYRQDHLSGEGISTLEASLAGTTR